MALEAKLNDFSETPLKISKRQASKLQKNTKLQCAYFSNAFLELGG